MVNSCAPSILKRSRLAHLYATNERRAKKRLKYLHNATARGELFRPLIFETHGKISEEVDVTLDMLASRTPMDQGLAKTDMKLRGNARQLGRQSPGHNEQGTEDELFTQLLAEAPMIGIIELNLRTNS